MTHFRLFLVSKTGLQELSGQPTSSNKSDCRTALLGIAPTLAEKDPLGVSLLLEQGKVSKSWSV